VGKDQQLRLAAVMKPSSLRRIENLRRLVRALGQGGMGPGEVRQLLDVSHTAARTYLDELEQAGIAAYERACRSRLRLLPDETAVRRYLAALAEGVTRPRVALRRRDPLVAALFGTA
jgi:DNA-binding transcriptional ArsR family regulator